MKVLYGIFTFVGGFVFAFIFAVIFASNGSNGIVTNGAFLNGIAFISGTILFLSCVVVVCTIMIIDELKNKKK